MSKFKGKKTNNAKITAKKDIRLEVLSFFDCASVLEVFCGSGEMYRYVWSSAQNYIGIDKNKYFDERKTICGDAEKIIRKVDLSEFNIFDIDAYGSPYEIADYITLNIPQSDKLAFIFTDGVEMDLRMGRICKGIRAMTGLDGHVLKKANLIHCDLIKKTIETIEQRLKMRVILTRIAKGVTGSKMHYWAIVLTRDAD
jgi:hypothetical protein